MRYMHITQLLNYSNTHSLLRMNIMLSKYLDIVSYILYYFTFWKVIVFYLFLKISCNFNVYMLKQYVMSGITLQQLIYQNLLKISFNSCLVPINKVYFLLLELEYFWILVSFFFAPFAKIITGRTHFTAVNIPASLLKNKMGAVILIVTSSGGKQKKKSKHLTSNLWRHISWRLLM